MGLPPGREVTSPNFLNVSRPPINGDFWFAFWRGAWGIALYSNTRVSPQTSWSEAPSVALFDLPGDLLPLLVLVVENQF